MENQLLDLPLLCGGIFLLAGMIMYLFPPKKINSLYGYRTSSSMASDERWQFAQKFSAIRMIIGGVFCVVLSAAGLLFPILYEAQFPVGISIILLVVFYVLYATEKALKAKFPNK